VRVYKKRKAEELDKIKTDIKKLEDERKKKIQRINDEIDAKIQKKKVELQRKKWDLEDLTQEESLLASKMERFHKDTSNKKTGFWARIFGKNK